MTGRSRRLSPESIQAAALRYLARRDRTESQVRMFLLHRGATSSQARVAIGRLKDLGYVDDEAFARRWAEERISRRPMGSLRLETELLTQGIPEGLARQVIAQVYRHRSERQLAQSLLETRMKARLTTVQQMRLLRGHGFDEDTIEEVLAS